MCGIVGYIGSRDSLPIIVNGLEKLEYRGYDSAGIALLEGGTVKVTRALGKLSELKKVLGPIEGRTPSPIGVGHTRWATHGKPSELNAHPHSAGRVSLVHNGIIENYVELKGQLIKQGCDFKSETDTEIAAHLLNKKLELGLQPYEALKAACKELHGSYAFLAFDKNHPDRLLVAKYSSPIIIGIGEGEMFVASDIPAILSETRRIIILEDGDIAEITIDGVKIENNGVPVTREPITITWDPATAQKGGFKHYMLKEIHEQGSAVADTFRGRISRETGTVELHEIDSLDLSQVDRIVLTACGTAWHACLVAKFYIEKFAGIPCEVDYASEFRYRDPILTSRTLMVVVSQSGETADTLAALEMASKKCNTLAVCNVLGSSISRKAKHVVFTHAGPEISVASTKAFTTQLVMLYLLGIACGQKKGLITAEQSRLFAQDLSHLPSNIDESLKLEKQIEEIAKRYSKARDFLFISRGNCYPVALEGALKLKEISYIHAEGYPAGELKHGPIALIDENMPVVVVLQRSEVYPKALSNLKEVESRGGQIIAITDAPVSDELRKSVSDIIEVPFISANLSPVILTLPLQLLAYYIAVLNGTDVDQPRNLAKSVTVE